MGQATKTISDASFEADVLNAEQPVLVDFWAEWCGPCKMIAPILDELANDLNGKVTIAKLNVDENPMIASKAGIRSIPALKLYKGGVMVAERVGGMPKAQLKQWIEGFL
jgi:thioredoxin 1